MLRRELEDVACAHAEDLVMAVPDIATALAWPENAAVAAVVEVED